MTDIRIGTRGSALAMWQARHVQEQLVQHHPDLTVEIAEIKTKGDIIQEVSLASLPGKAFFTKEIEDALLNGSVDLAVHSGKDVPTTLPEGLGLAGFMRRHTSLDAWLARDGETLETLPEGGIVGTSSLRRRALISKLRPDLKVLDLRGNVDTRLRKLDEGQYDAIVLAAAGLERLGQRDRITAKLDPRTFPPAVSQGAMALEIRVDDDEARYLTAPLIDPETCAAVTAERALLRELEGGCQVPLGALATVQRGEIHLFASLLAVDGSERIDGESQGRITEADNIGTRLARTLLSRGGDRILEQIRRSEEDERSGHQAGSI